MCNIEVLRQRNNERNPYIHITFSLAYELLHWPTPILYSPLPYLENIGHNDLSVFIQYVNKPTREQEC